MKTKLENIIKKSKWTYVNKNLTAENFPIPEKIETENWKIITMKGYFSSQEALDEIKLQGCRPANAYELVLWLQKHPKEVLKGKGYTALGQMWQDSNGYHRVPSVRRFSGGAFRFFLVDFEGVWSDIYVLLAFCDSVDLSPVAKSPSFPKELIINGITYTQRLKQLSKTIIAIKSSTPRFIVDATEVFTGYLDSDFKNWKTDADPDASDETPWHNTLEVKELEKYMTFDQIFSKPDDMCLSQEQIIDFCKNHKNELAKDLYMFFLFKIDTEFFVARVHVGSDGRLYTHVFRFDYDFVWDAEDRHSFVIPQQGECPVHDEKEKPMTQGEK